MLRSVFTFVGPIDRRSMLGALRVSMRSSSMALRTVTSRRIATMRGRGCVTTKTANFNTTDKDPPCDVQIAVDMHAGVDVLAFFDRGMRLVARQRLRRSR